MLPLVPALALAFLSFIASAFVILRIVVPILPPHPLSKRVSPAEFGLPSFGRLSPADKSHLWLACLDLIALSLFVWQAVDESTSGPSGLALATNPGAAVRTWIAVTIRQTCLLFIAAITLLHIRMAQSVSFGARQWMLWAPTALLVVTSTTIAGLLSGTGVHSLFYGVTAYTVGVAVLSSVAFACLIRTLFVIKRNLTASDEPTDQWPPVREVEEKPRPSFATEDIDAIRDGASWITSDAGSKRYSASAWSFSTHHTTHSHGRPQTSNHPSVPAKSSFWFGSATQGDIQVPPVPPLPSPYGPPSSYGPPSPYGPLSPPLTADPDPFRKDSSETFVNNQKPRMGSQTSWLTSSAGSHTTVTAWSFPETQHDGTHQEATTLRNPSPQDYHTAPNSIRGGSRPLTPNMANAQVLGGYGYMEAERGLTAYKVPVGSTVNISYVPAIGWSVMIWLPLAFALPYFIMLSQSNTPSSTAEILFVLSVTLSSPLLALNLLCGSPLPIPVGLFDVHDSLPADPNRQLTLAGSFPPAKFSQFSHEYKRSTSCSVTVVEARRSGDVWLSKGDAVDGKGKVGRAVTMLSATPKLSVLPPEEPDELDMPPIPFREDVGSPVHVHGTPNSEMSAQFGRLRGAGSKQSSHLSANRESEEYSGGKIMTAQRHYSALAQTMIVPGGSIVSGSAGTRDSVGANTLFSTTTGVGSKRNSHNSHLRSRSVTSVGPQSINGEAGYSPSPPPSFPLPPTPPNVRAARLAMLQHKKSFSSGFSLGTNHDDMDDEMNEIDAMTAGVLPILVPGLKLGDDMRIKDGRYSPPGTFSKSKGLKAMKKLAEFGEDFSSPEVHSTPARGKRQARQRKESGHKKNHFSLPSLSLGKEGLQSLATWGSNVLGNSVGQYTAIPSNVDMGRRAGVAGSESNIDAIAQQLGRVDEEEDLKSNGAKLTRSMSKRTLGLRADVPHNVDTARSSYASVGGMPPPSAASTVTLFEEFEAELAMHSGPQAESTPHNSVSTKPISRHPPPPMPPPKDQQYLQQQKQKKRGSTIRYIKSDEAPAENVRYAFEDTPPSSNQRQPAPINPFSGSARTVRPLVSKASKLSRSPSDKEPGLRSLTLLQDRGNVVRNSVTDGTRPLVLQAKEKKSRRQNQVQDENAPPPGTAQPATKSKNLKQLTLVRSETSKQRAILRKTEVLPDVVVRPPSMTEHNSFSYSFRD